MRDFAFNFSKRRSNQRRSRNTVSIVIAVNGDALAALGADELVVDLAQGRSQRFPIWRIPNVELLLQLIQSGVS